MTPNGPTEDSHGAPRSDALEDYARATIRGVENRSVNEFLKRTMMPLNTEQKLRLDCAIAVASCAKDLDVQTIEQLAYKANLLMQFVLDGKPIKRT
jgi:hypothetical protein